MVHAAIWVILFLSVSQLLGGQQPDDTSQGRALVGAEPNEFTRINGPEDHGIPLPRIENAGHSKDPSAIHELIEYLNAVGVTSWNGMQAKGLFVQPNGESSDASLAIGSYDQLRMDIKTPSGTKSTRIAGGIGMTIEADGKRVPLTPDTARAGLIVFPRLFSPEFGQLASAIIDRGQVEVDGEPLHRITVEEPILADGTPTEYKTANVTDLYFDPVNHLLRMNSSLLRLGSGDRESYLFVTRYANYQPTGTMLIPHNIRQTLNGQKQWALELTEIELQPKIVPSYFQF